MHKSQDKKKDFDLKIKDSLCYSTKMYTNDERYPVYFCSEYVEKLKKYFRDNNITCYDKREMVCATRNNKNLIRMCSAASSARLAFFYFYDKNIILEKECPNGLKGTSPQLDGWDKATNTYYECKCHEIFDRHSSLKLMYENKLKELFNLDDLEIIDDEDEPFFDIKMKDLGYENDMSIYSLHLDVKQLICHLVGLEYSGGYKPTLQYIFFIPNGGDPVYDILKKEWNMIIESKPFLYFKEHYPNIKIADPMFVPVSEVDDFIANKIKNIDVI